MVDGGADIIDEPVERARIEDESLAELLQRLVQNGKDLARAEITRLRAQFFRRIVEARFALLLGIASILLVQAAVIVMLTGILLVVGAYIGMGWATVLVTIGGLIVAMILGRVAVDRIRKAAAAQDELT